MYDARNVLIVTKRTGYEKVVLDSANSSCQALSNNLNHWRAIPLFLDSDVHSAYLALSSIAMHIDHISLSALLDSNA